MFAEVALPVHVRQTFTYALPPDLADRAQIGCRVLVPLGKRLLTGFIVDLHKHPRADQREPTSDEELELDPLPLNASDDRSFNQQNDAAIDVIENIKEVRDLLDDEPVITPEIFELARWISEYYYAPLGECLRAAMPIGAASATTQVITLTEAGWDAIADLRSSPRITSSRQQALLLMADNGHVSMRALETHTTKARARALLRELERDGLVRITQKSKPTGFRPKTQNVVRIVSETQPDQVSRKTRIGSRGNDESHSETGLLRSGHKRRKLTDQQRRVIELLHTKSQDIPLSELTSRANVSASVVRSLEKRGALQILPVEVRRDPLQHVRPEPTELVKLNPEQQSALETIGSCLDQRKYASLLLHGVTGSGKTEVYIRAMLTAVRRGRTALMLVPEISLTPALARRLRSHFGESIAILHSALSEGERGDEWRRIKEGGARVVIGTRSAVFAPLQRLGLIIVDEEHETSYKQEESPRYNGRDTAIMRAAQTGAVVVLGSATPSIESFHNARVGKYAYLRLNTRYANRPLAQVQMVDMREVFRRHGKQQVLSDELKEAIAATHAQGEQTIILLNRRGFSAFALCRSCGQSIQCPNCDVTLTYHRYNQSLLCHYCNYVRPAPRQCPACEGMYLHYVGEGTEQIEARLRELFPQINIARVDRDTTRRRGSFEQIAMEFEAGSIDLLIGTQMLAKGHDFPNVTLVGVVSVDVGLSFPDFRAAERTFQLLTQVAGRSGRGARRGRVIIQTYHPGHYALLSAQEQDYEAFYKREVGFRQAMHYPPFTALINILVHDKNLDRASGAAADLARELREAAANSGAAFRILGPAPAPIGRLKGEYRFQVLIKTSSRKLARQALDEAMDLLTTRSRNTDQRRYSTRLFSIEVDPISLM